MTREKEIKIEELIERALKETKRMWDEKSKSHAYIVGYLEGCLETIKWELKK